QDPLHTGPHVLTGRSRAPAGGRAGVGLPGEVVEVGTLGVVQLKRPGEPLEDALRDAGEIAALEAGGVGDAHPGERGGLPATPSRWAGRSEKLTCRPPCRRTSRAVRSPSARKRSATSAPSVADRSKQPSVTTSAPSRLSGPIIRSSSDSI